jgi:hypothetical protein
VDKTGMVVEECLYNSVVNGLPAYEATIMVTDGYNTMVDSFNLLINDMLTFFLKNYKASLGG